jgi:hypothetical protein
MWGRLIGQNWPITKIFSKNIIMRHVKIILPNMGYQKIYF